MTNSAEMCSSPKHPDLSCSYGEPPPGVASPATPHGGELDCQRADAAVTRIVGRLASPPAMLEDVPQGLAQTRSFGVRGDHGSFGQHGRRPEKACYHVRELAAPFSSFAWCCVKRVHDAGGCGRLTAGEKLKPQRWRATWGNANAAGVCTTDVAPEPAQEMGQLGSAGPPHTSIRERG